MKKETTNDKVWIVKASESILGPFSIEELAKAVRTRHVGLLDEARVSEGRHDPKSRIAGRWVFVRDIPEVQAAISELLKTEETVERTHSANHTQLSVTKRLDDDNTPVPPAIPIVPATTKVAAPSANAAPVSAPSSASTPIRTYGVSTKKSNPWGRWLVMAGVGALLFVGLSLYLERKTWESSQKRLWAQFQQSYVAQIYSDAYFRLKEYQLEYPEQPAALTRAGFLFLNPGRELIKAKRLFERSMQLDPQNKELMVQNLNGLGLVSLYEGAISQAQSYLNKALALEPSNHLTMMNLISLALTRNQWDDAWQLSEAISTSDPKKASLLQGMLVLLSQRHQSKAHAVMADLMRSLDQSSYLRPEMRLIILRLSSLSNDNITFESQLKQFFEDLPSLQISFSENPMVDQRWRDWNFLYQFCMDVNGPSSLAAEMLGLQVVCVSQIQKWSEAEKIVSEGLKRFPNHPKLVLSQVHMLSSMGRWPEVRALMRLPILKQESAANWMFAKSCLEEHNSSCTESYLNAIATRAYTPTPIYELKARLHCRGSNLSGCRDFVGQGLSQDPLESGLLEIRFRLEDSL